MIKLIRTLLLSGFFIWILNSCSSVQAEGNLLNDKVKGMNYSGPGGGPFGPEPFTSMKAIGSNFVAFIPEAVVYQNSLKMKHAYSGDKAWYGETTEGVLEGIYQARKIGLKVMIKPHLYPGIDLTGFERPTFDRADTAARRAYYAKRYEYIQTLDFKTRKRSSWRGDLIPKDEAGWEILSEEYRKFILSYAVLADTMDIELFCIGTELKAMALEKPDYWRNLITEVRGIYSGPITYAANWDSYDQITFWEDLDYIGIDAYFPLGDHRIPTVEQSVDDWQKYKEKIGHVQMSVDKPVIFTEWGYESEEYAGRTPWESSSPFNEEVQANLYEATFQSFWNEPWFQGVFIWRWSPKDEFSTGTYNFSPKERAAEKVLEKWFKKD
ncbi:glycoside hydrolase TIM-barrel-like domain-containing protein [Ekhidna sp.]|uniref:glycoside hydrolase family 113 n=1 Tax=Ekhidna sp. TaxID=2608089 RepID=UPI003297C1F3